MSYDELSGGGKFWNAKINETGFMGFVDKWWIFWNRVGVSFAIVFLIISIISSILVILTGKESFKTSRLRHQNKKYN